MPESPRYLSLVNRNEEAWAIIKKIHHDPTDDEDTAAHAEYIQIIKQVEADKETGRIHCHVYQAFVEEKIFACTFLDVCNTIDWVPGNHDFPSHHILISRS
jgi:hypothetical protein